MFEGWLLWLMKWSLSNKLPKTNVGGTKVSEHTPLQSTEFKPSSAIRYECIISKGLCIILCSVSLEDMDHAIHNVVVRKQDSSRMDLATNVCLLKRNEYEKAYPIGIWILNR